MASLRNFTFKKTNNILRAYGFCLMILALIPPTRAQYIYTVAGNDDFGDGGPALDSYFRATRDVFLDQAGNIYIADPLANVVRKINNATGIIETVAGNAKQSFSGDGGLATAASLSEPWGVHVDDAGNIYIADRGNNRIRKVDGATGIIQTVAGNGMTDSSGDGGVAVEAGLFLPAELFVSATGTVFIADWKNHRIRMVTAGGTFEATIASDESETTSNSTFSITLDFNRTAPGFDAGDLTLSNAEAGEIITSDNRNFVIPITPQQPGLVEVRLEADKLQDLAGNNNLASNTFEIMYAAKVTGIPNHRLLEGLKIFPVPAGNELNIELTSTNFSSVVEVKVLSLLGQTITSASMKNRSTRIPLNDIKPGVYVVKVMLDEYSASGLITIDK